MKKGSIAELVVTLVALSVIYVVAAAGSQQLQLRGQSLPHVAPPAMFQQQQDQDPPWVPGPGNSGQPGHKEPPEGWNCNRAEHNIDPSHNCDCQRHCPSPPDEQDQGGSNPEMTVVEDPVCTVYCHPSHCRCPLKNCP